MKQIFVRPAREADLKKLTSWIPQNAAWDPTLYQYPSTLTWCAFNSSGVVAFLPVQQPLMMEALLFHPLSTSTQRAYAMKEFTCFAVAQSYQRGSGEVYFLCPEKTPEEKTTCEFARNWGFERVEMPVYRIRLVDLERGGGNGCAQP